MAIFDNQILPKLFSLYIDLQINPCIDNLFYQGHGHDKVRQFWLFLFTKQKYLAFSGNYCVSYSKARDNGRVSL